MQTHSNTPSATDALPTPESDRIRYALSKQLPDMLRGFTIQTSYGDIVIEGGQGAERIRKVVESVLLRELAEVERAAA